MSGRVVKVIDFCPKAVISSHKLKDRKYNGQNRMDKKTNNDLQNIIQKTKD
jgi:hypothetical protein